MSQFTQEALLEAANRIKATFDDGFQLADIAVLLREGTLFAEAFALPGEEKKQIAVDLISKVIDDTDIPWMPDALVDPLLKSLVPNLIDLVCEAAAGKLPVNLPSGEDTSD